MKNLLVFILILFTSTAISQTLIVEKVEAVTTVEQGYFFHPVAGPTGKILFSKAGYSGLYLLDQNANITLLSDKAGAGYMPVFSDNGNDVYFRYHEYQAARKYSSLVKKTLVNNDEQVIISKERHFTSAKKLASGKMAISKDFDLHIIDNAQEKTEIVSEEKTVFAERGMIALYSNGQKKLLTPSGEGFYLWPSLSPDGTKLLFTKIGQGTYISTLDGDILAELGNANAAQWSPDGKWVVYMRDQDDGHKITNSDIYVTSVNGETTLAITNTDDRIEVYPSWVLPKEIVFGTERGIIYKAILD